MSRCPGLHCPGCGDVSLSTILALAAAVAAVVLAVIFAAVIIITVAVVVAVLLALAAFFGVRAWRRGWRPSLDPVVAYTPLPEPERARPLRAQEFHLHLHGPLTREQLAEAAEVIRRQAITDRREHG